MATSRGQTPPVNLKERIAALQQRNVSPSTHQSAQPALKELSSAGTGGLRDRIAKFEEKGGVPVPRGSFGMGAPQLAENAPPKKRGELYGNRVPGLGRPSGASVGQSGSQHPSTDESPGPRKRCISTGAAVSNGPPSFSTDEPVPPLPDGVSGSAPRRNSLAVNFGSGRRVASTSDAGDKVVEPFDALSPLSAETADPQPPSVGPAVEAALEEEEEEEEEEPPPSSLEEPKIQPSEPPPTVEQPLPTVSVDPKVAPAKDLVSSRNPPLPIPNISQQSPTLEQGSKDGQSDYGTAPQSAVSQPSPSQPSPSQPEPTSSVPPFPPTDTPSVSRRPSRIPVRAEATVVCPPTSPPPKVTKQTNTSKASAIPTLAPDSNVLVSPSISAPNLLTEARPQSKPTFKAVVHRRVTEPAVPPTTFNLDPSSTSQLPQKRRGASGNIVPASPTPGIGDLAVLLEDAALLELRLTGGDSTGLKAKDLLPNTPTPTSTTFQPNLRQSSASTLTERAPTTVVDSGSQSERSVSIPSIREPLIDGEIPEGDETDGRSLASTTFSQRSPSHRKYLSNIYRLTGRRSSGYMPGAYPRDSMSMSSEDSSPVTTPSDNGKRKGFGIPWPSASPKKDSPTVSRSSSFADKIFNRNRTRSNVSSADQVSERNSVYESSQPTLTLSFPSELAAEAHPDGADGDSRTKPWISPGDSNSEFSPTSSPLDKDIFDAFPSVPQTLPPGFHPGGDNTNIGRTSALPVNGRKQVNQRLSMV